MGYYKELMKFIAVSNKQLTGQGTVGVQEFNQDRALVYDDLKVEAKFGTGRASAIPWIAFLSKYDTVQNGIYPVYLYYKEKNILILAYGISETYEPNRSWNLKNGIKINEYFLSTYNQSAVKYGDSFVYKVYDLKKVLEEKNVNDDLNTLISIYKLTLLNVNSYPIKEELKKLTLNKSLIEQIPFNIVSFQEKSLEAGLIFSPQLIQRFVASLFTKPFVICSGLSGSGKTKLAQAFVLWICQEKSQYRIIPVGADWTNREPLLGYPNALKPEEYVKPDSGVLDLIIQANNQPDLPHFLILDEMNLSHVERYFADFLSVMESKEEIPLYAEGTVQNGVPAKLKVPSNLFIIGTVNIDETTNMFSPKVLDRANTIEFRVTQDEMKNFLGNIRDINLDALNGKGAGMAKSFLEMAASREFGTTNMAEINAALVQFFGELKKTGAEFGYRSATEILRLIHQLTVLDNTLTTHKKIDIAIIQKLLPKLHGSRRKLCPVLEILGSFCITGNVSIIKDVFDKADFDYNGANVLYPLSLEKIARMYRGAIDNGFASFAEA
jgi:5-methylcytosine-specific restriction protein B